MTMTLKVHVLDWYMKFSMVPTSIPHKTLDHIEKGLIYEFRKPKSMSQCITKLKEIKQFPTESVWDFDQRLKNLMAKVSFLMSYVQHKEWFIAVMLLHIHIPLMQKNIVSQSKSLELAMKLEVSSIEETGARMMQKLSQLANLTL